MSTQSQGRQVLVQGRIVWVSGDLFKGKLKLDMNTKQPVIDQKTGQPVMEYGFGLAVPKSVLNQTGAGQPGEIWAAMHEEAFSLYPSRQLPPSFAMKYKDGDGIDDKGVSFAQREGYAGHIVLACTTRLPIKFFKHENGQNFQINEGIKCGDYVNVQLTVKAHPAMGQGKPGLYLNPNAVQFLGFGKEIINTPSGDAIFGTAAPAIPQGASATPIAPPGMIVPQGAPAAPQGYPQTPQGYPQQQAAPVQPHWAILPQAHQPQAAPAMPAAPQTPANTGYPASPAAPTAYPSSPAPVPGMPQQPAGFPPLPGYPQQ